MDIEINASSPLFLILRLFESLVCIQEFVSEFNQSEWGKQNPEQLIRSREI